MKKSLLLLLGLLSWMQCSSQTDFNLSPEEEKEAWEFILNTFFSQGVKINNDANYPEKFNFEIKFNLRNPSIIDSISLQTTIATLDSILPQKVYYINSEEDANFIIDINTHTDSIFFDFSHKPLVANKEVDPKTGHIKYLNRILLQEFKLKVNGKYRLKAIRNTAIIGLLAGFKYTKYTDGFTSDYKRENPDFNSILKNFFIHKSFSEMQFQEIPSLDKFILQKIYSQNLSEQVENYVWKEYSLWQYLNWKFGSSTAKALKILIFILYFIVALFLGYKIIFNKDHLKALTKYILSSVYIGLILDIAFLIEVYTPIYQTEFLTEVNPHINYHDIIELIIIVPIVTFTTLIIYHIEKFTLAEIKNLSFKSFLRFIIQLLISLSILYALTLIFYLSGNLNAFNQTNDIILPATLIIIIAAFARSVLLYFEEKNENLIFEKDLQLSSLSASKAEAEVASLHARINPHFLYNSLNSIAGLAHIDADKTEKMALSLSDLFRHNLNRKNEAFCTIKDEVEAAIAYMDIEQIRFGVQLQFNTELDESLYNYLIPRNIIQPLLENAIKHGISKLNKPGKIELRIIQNEDMVEIAVYDNGPDFKEGSISGYGLQSIFDILKLTYNNEATLNWENTPEKSVWISIDKNALIKE